MQWTWVNAGCSIHRVLHTPSTGSSQDQLSPATSQLSSLGGPYCTQLSTFPRLRVNQWIESQLPSHLPSDLPPPNRLPASTPPISIDHGLQVYLQTRRITAFKFASSRTPSAYLQTRSIAASKCISKLARSRPKSASPNSLDHALKVHLSTRSITASKYIANDRRRVYGDTGVTEVDWATGSTYSGDPGVDRHHIIFISSGTTQLRGFSRPSSIISSHFLPRLLELEPPIMLDYHLWPDWPYVYI